jgi:sialic acid synthase SpsE
MSPGYGMHPKHFEAILGKTFNQDIDNEERLLINMIQK